MIQLYFRGLLGPAGGMCSPGCHSAEDLLLFLIFEKRMELQRNLCMIPSSHGVHSGVPHCHVSCAHGSGWEGLKKPTALVLSQHRLHKFEKKKRVKNKFVGAVTKK